ncbi:aromatase/cyclase [Streptomyces sp. enrichment culture]|uniref:aromatase/cyclase n=1 Tax=Streptomyces sp. enrichment culture TaxID=1795815 RepID=UPI003F55AE8E
MQTVHHTRHEVLTSAPPDHVFALVADVTGWPQVFGPTVHAEVAEEKVGEQLLRIWAFANDEVRSWTSRRTLDRSAGTIAFRQVVSSPPVAGMGGEWRVERVGDATRVVLLHDYTVVDDDPGAAAWVASAVEHNSEAELAALRGAAETGVQRPELTFSFSDSTEIQGSADDVYAFLDRADAWPQRLPHVAAARFTEEPGGVQVLDMDTRSPDGSVHNTRSVRVSFPDRGLLVYKQLKVPPVMTGHTGRWTVERHGDTVTATSWHTVSLDPAGVREQLGAQTTPAEARTLVRHALGTNSSTTLRYAKEYAEKRQG